MKILKGDGEINVEFKFTVVEPNSSEEEKIEEGLENLNNLFE